MPKANTDGKINDCVCVSNIMIVLCIFILFIFILMKRLLHICIPISCGENTGEEINRVSYMIVMMQISSMKVTIISISLFAIISFEDFFQ